MLRHWILAARPKTLAAAIMPVITASALARSEGQGNLTAALLCIVFALLMQVAANYINDLFDYLKGNDGEDRLGPLRACAQGWITPAAMKRGIALTLVLACIAGLCLIPFGGWPLVIVGAACVLFAFLYTTLLSYVGCGDVLVWLFFGFVPVLGTYYVQAGTLSPSAWLLAAGCGLVTDTLLVLNNFRDRDQDAAHGKHTLVVTFGGHFGSLFYFLQGVAGALCVVCLYRYGHHWMCLPLIYLIFHYITWHEMARIDHGRALNRILGKTARNMLLFALLTTLALLLPPDWAHWV